METILHHHTQLEPICFEPSSAPEQIMADGDWTTGLPTLRTNRIVLRELEKTDAPSLLSLLTTEEVAKFISPPPTTLAGFVKFVEWAKRERKAGNQFMFGIVPDGHDTAVGLVQVRATAPGFAVAEWGFAVGSPFWGSGMFMASARTTLDFAFDRTAVNRLEARAVVQNGRGNGALRKLGAVQEGVLRGSLVKDGKCFDQIMWSIVSQDWYQSKAIWGARVQ